MLNSLPNSKPTVVFSFVNCLAIRDCCVKFANISSQDSCHEVDLDDGDQKGTWPVSKPELRISSRKERGNTETVSCDIWTKAGTRIRGSERAGPLIGWHWHNSPSHWSEIAQGPLTTSHFTVTVILSALDNLQPARDKVVIHKNILMS